jgi:CubicO group peptidase (beta-lactamase class C family)
MRRLTLVLTIALAVLALRAQTAPAPAPTVSSRGSAEITAYLAAAVARGDVPGVVALVTNRDRVIYHEAFGQRNDDKKLTMSKDTIFNIASMTKPVTSLAVMMLVEEGKLRLDDPASKYLPELATLPVMTNVNLQAETYATRPAARPITIRHLLTHTSGIGYTFSDPGLAMVQRKTKAADLALPLVHDPGERWTYGASTRVLGDIIVKITGRPLDEYLATRLLKPLGMTDTGYAVPADKVDRVVTVHTRMGPRWAEQRRVDPPPVTVRGDGGLYSTAADYAMFMRLLLNEGSAGSTRLAMPATIRDMKRNQIGGLVVPLQPTADPARSKDVSARCRQGQVGPRVSADDGSVG